MAKVSAWLRKHLGGERRFSFLLVFLLFYFFLGPVFDREVQGASLGDVLFTLVLLAMAYAASEKKRVLYAGLLILGPTLVVSWLVHVHPSTALVLANHLLVLLFLACIGFAILSSVMRNERVTLDKISAALCSYLILGVIWAYLFSLLELLLPGSFKGAAAVLGSGAEDIFQRSGFENALYFSFTTLTTLGYGDVTPVTRVAQNLCAMEAVLGQVYLTVLVARLVGLEISHSSRRNVS